MNDKKRMIPRIFIAMALLTLSGSSYAQFKQLKKMDFQKALSGVVKATQAFTLTDEQMADYVRESVNQMDANNPVLPEDSPYTQRLRRITEGITDADGIPLNFKVYHVTDINAFACPDGSVRVFSALMDLMSDDELMGVIGHEIGHVLKRHSKNAFKNELLTGALKDVVASTSKKAATLTESQLSQLGESLMSARFSQKQENEADDCGYDFLVAKGRNPWGIVMSFEKLMSMEGDSGNSMSYIQKMFSSHPDTQKRIKHMQKRCEEDGFARPAAM